MSNSESYTKILNAAAQASKIKNPEQLNYRLLLQLLRDYDAKEAVSENAVLDLLNYVADMLVGHPREFDS